MSLQDNDKLEPFKVYDELKLFTVNEAKEITSKSVASWRRAILKKQIAFVRLGRSVRIPLSEIKRVIKEGWNEADRT